VRHTPFPFTLGNFTENISLDSTSAYALRGVKQDAGSLGFSRVQIGQKGNDVECSYQKAEYSGATLYFDGVHVPGLNSAPDAIKFVDKNIPATTTDQRKKNNIFVGWRGYCLETDPNTIINGDLTQRACLTWYPSDHVSQEYDIFSNTPEAGFQAASDLWYCMETGLLTQRYSRLRGGGVGGDFCASCSTLLSINDPSYYYVCCEEGYTAICPGNQAFYCVPEGVGVYSESPAWHETYLQRTLPITSWLVANEISLNVCKTAAKFYDPIKGNSAQTNNLWKGKNNQYNTPARSAPYDVTGHRPFGAFLPPADGSGVEVVVQSLEDSAKLTPTGPEDPKESKSLTAKVDVFVSDAKLELLRG